MRADDEALTGRWRGVIVALAALLALGLIAESLAPAMAAASGRETDATLAQVDLERLQKARSRKSEVGPEIIGGRAVSQGKDRFMAFVLADNGVNQVQCGGSLIAPLFVLTAAHCVQNAQAIVLDPGAFTIVVGAANLNQVKSGNVRGVSAVFQHPLWNPETFENDVAVLRLDVAVPESIAQPIPFVASGQTTYDGAGQPVDVAGWGVTDSGFTANQLRQTTVNVVADGSCQAAYAGLPQQFIPSVMICAAATAKDSCQGDSGGPLFAQEFVGFTKKKKKTKHGKKRKKKVAVYQQVQSGIVSWGIGCATPEFPGIYTRLSAPGINDFVVQVINS
jgi:secreted trypsin-like serine protease